MADSAKNLRYSLKVFFLVTSVATLLQISLPFWSPNEVVQTWEVNVTFWHSFLGVLGPLAVFFVGIPNSISDIIGSIVLLLFPIPFLLSPILYEGSRRVKNYVWFGVILWVVIGFGYAFVDV